MYKQLLNKLIELGLKPAFRHKDIQNVRKRAERFVRLSTPPTFKLKQQTITLNHCSLKHCYLKQNSNSQQSILYLHGGAFCLPLVKLYFSFFQRLSHYIKADIYAPDYRLAPENPYPAAIDDAFETYQYLLKTKPDNDIILMGDSAGGFLALSLMHQINQAKLPTPHKIILISPVTDLNLNFESAHEFANSDVMFQRSDLKRLFKHFAPTDSATDVLLNPLKGDYSHWPATQIHVSDREILKDDSIKLAKRIQQHQHPVELKVWKGAPHVQPILSVWPDSKVALLTMKKFVLGK